MTNKCLIINGSPRANGNTYFLINKFAESYVGDIKVVNAYALYGTKGISGCLDCEGCRHVQGCVVNDAFQTILKDDYKSVMIASPIFMSNLPGPMINLINRFNYQWNNQEFLGIKTMLSPKRAKLLLLGGGSACKSLMGENNQDLPIKQAKYIFKHLNANLNQEDIVLALNTDEEKVEENIELISQVKQLALD